MSAVLAMALKEWRLLLRDPGSLALLFVMPSIFILVFSLSLQGVFSSDEDEERMDILAALDNGESAARLAQSLEETGHFHIIPSPDGDAVRRSIEQGTHEIGVIVAGDSVEVVTDPVLPGEIALAVTSTLAVTGQQLAIERMEAAIDELEDAVKTMEASIDDLEDATSELLEVNRDLLETLLEVHGHLKKAMSLMPPGMKPKVSPKEMEAREAEIQGRIEETEQKAASLGRDRPGAVSTGPGSAITVTQTVVTTGGREVRMNSVQANVPGWTIFGLFWIVQILALSIITERASGAYGRILVAPVSFASYLVGKSIPYLVVNLVQAAIMFGIGIWVLPLFGAPGLSIANPTATLLLTLVISLCAIAFGLFMASLTRSAFLVGSVSAVILVIMTALGGIMVPTFVMPPIMQKMSLLVPHGWALQGYLDVIVRGRPVTSVLPHIAVLLGFACAFFLFSVVRMRSVDRSA